MAYQFNEAQEAWLKALESGEYEQTQSVLHDGRGYCCLGVACSVLGLDFKFDELSKSFKAEDHDIDAPESVLKKLRLKGREAPICDEEEDESCYIEGIEAISLADANDSGATFSQIAAFIRSNPTAVFKE